MPFSQTLCNDYQIDNKGLVLLCFEGEKKLSTAIEDTFWSSDNCRLYYTTTTFHTKGH